MKSGELLTKGKTGVLKGFKNKQGKRFDAALVFDADFNTGFVFPERRTVRHPPKRESEEWEVRGNPPFG